MSVHRLASCALLILSMSATAAADEIDRYLEARIAQLHIPGLSVAIVRDGRVVKRAGYGFADLSHQVPAAASTVYEIGSVTKQFTAVALMILANEGRLGLDDGLAVHLPGVPPAWAGVTLRHLLSHTSGIRNHVGIQEFMAAFTVDLDLQVAPTRDELLRRFYRLPLEFQPGATWAYDNTGYWLLGLVVEKVSGQTYWEFLQHRIFTPLGMRHTRNTDPRPVVPRRATGYRWTKDRFEMRPVLPPEVAFSAGALLSTVEDLARWEAALATDRLLPLAALEEAWTATRTASGSRAPFDYGFGWFVSDRRGQRIVQHSGGTPGFSSTIYRFRDDRLTVILLANHADRILDQLALDVAGLVMPALKRQVTAVDPEPTTTARLRAVLEDLLRRTPDSQAFTDPMRLFLTTTSGKGLFEWLAWHGELKALEFSEREVDPDGRRVRYRATLGSDLYWLTFRLDAQDRIAQISWW